MPIGRRGPRPWRRGLARRRLREHRIRGRRFSRGRTGRGSSASRPSASRPSASRPSASRPTPRPRPEGTAPLRAATPGNVGPPGVMAQMKNVATKHHSNCRAAPDGHRPERRRDETGNQRENQAQQPTPPPSHEAVAPPHEKAGHPGAASAPGRGRTRTGAGPIFARDPRTDPRRRRTTRGDRTRKDARRKASAQAIPAAERGQETIGIVEPGIRFQARGVMSGDPQWHQVGGPQPDDHTPQDAGCHPGEGRSRADACGWRRAGVSASAGRRSPPARAPRLTARRARGSRPRSPRRPLTARRSPPASG